MVRFVRVLSFLALGVGLAYVLSLDTLEKRLKHIYLAIYQSYYARNCKSSVPSPHTFHRPPNSHVTQSPKRYSTQLGIHTYAEADGVSPIA